MVCFSGTDGENNELRKPDHFSGGADFASVVAEAVKKFTGFAIS